MPLFDHEAELRISQRIVASGRAKARETGFQSLLDSCQEGFEVFVHAMQYVLQNLRIDTFDFRALSFDLRQLSRLSVEANREMVDAEGLAPLLDGSVVEFTAKPEL